MVLRTNWIDSRLVAASLVVVGLFVLTLTNFYRQGDDLLGNAQDDLLARHAVAMNHELFMFYRQLETDLASGKLSSRSEAIYRHIITHSSALEKFSGDLDDQIASNIIDPVREYLRLAHEILFGHSGLNTARAQAIKEQLYELSGEVNVAMQTLVMDLSSEQRGASNLLHQRAQFSIIMSMVVVAASFLGVGYFIRASNNNEALAARNYGLVRHAQIASEAKSRLLTTLNHEIRTPMNGVLGLTSLVLEDELKAEHRQMITKVHDSAADLIGFLNDMLDFSELSRESTEEDRSIIVIASMFTGLQKRLQAQAVARNKKIVLHYDFPDHVLIRGDRRRINQSLYHLLVYFLKNTPDRALNIEFCIDEGVLAMRADFDFERGFDADWDLCDIVDDDATAHGKIVANTVDATIARAVISALGGEIELVTNPENTNHKRVLVFIPVEKMAGRRLKAVLFGSKRAARAVEQHFLENPIDWYQDRADLSQDIDLIFVENIKAWRARSCKLGPTLSKANLIAIVCGDGDDVFSPDDFNTLASDAPEILNLAG